MSEEQKRAAIYARIATSMADNTESVALQVTLCQGYGRAYHFVIEMKHIFEDRGNRSENPQEREPFTRLLDAARRREFAVLLLTSPDRVSRHEDHLQRALATFQELDIAVVFVLFGERQEGRFL